MENKQTQFNQFQIALVAGATGFIGRFLIAELLSQGHQVFALVRDRAKQQKDMENWLKNKNIAFDQLRFIQGDITQEDLAINSKDWEKLTTVNILYNASALFAWNLSMREGRKVNVEGALNLLTCVNQHCDLVRVVHVSGYMLTLQDHLRQAGVCIDQPEQTNWQRVYQQLGTYEASKIEAHYAWIKQAQSLGLDWTVIHPATVISDEVTGEIPVNQPIAHMISLLKRKKMSAIPATPQHYLPLVSIDYLVKVIGYAATETRLARSELLVAHEQRLTLADMFNIMAAQVGQKAPTRYVSLDLLRMILKWKWLAQKLEMSVEMLDFIRTESLNVSELKTLIQKWNIQESDLEKSLAKTSQWIYQHS